jgi:hypothetical protein
MWLVIFNELIVLGDDAVFDGLISLPVTSTKQKYIPET